MKLRGLAAVLSAGLVCATVAYFAADPMTAVEAVPVPPPAPTAIASAFAARNLSGVRQAIEAPGLTRDAPGLIDPFNAVTPEAVGPSGVPIPLPVAPESIKQELVTSLGKATAGALLTRPVSGRTTSKFGMRFHPILKVWKLHTGLDWAVPCGTPVGAAAPGTVVKAGWAGGNGIQVKIDHGMLRGHRVVTTYNHLSSIGVRVGQKVQALDGVGRVGSTGYSTGCHMHFEVIADGQFTNPEPWLNGNPVVVDLGSMDYSTVPTPTSAPPTVRPPSPTPTPTVPTSPTPTPPPSLTPSPSASPSVTPTPTPCPSATPSASPAPSAPPCVTPTPTPSPTPTSTPSPTPTSTPSPTPSPTPTPTPSPTPTQEDSPAPEPSPSEPASPEASAFAPASPEASPTAPASPRASASEPASPVASPSTSTSASATASTEE